MEKNPPPPQITAKSCIWGIKDTPHLHLVACSAKQNYEPEVNIKIKDGFETKVAQTNSSLFWLTITDLKHPLQARLKIDLPATSRKTAKEAVCQFPNIETDTFNNFVWEDETLFGCVLVSFQLKVLQELIGLCQQMDISVLKVMVEEQEALKLDVYREVTLSENSILTPRGKKVQMIFQVSNEICQEIAGLQDQASLKFNEILWHDQSHNPAIRYYLKSQLQQRVSSFITIS